MKCDSQTVPAHKSRCFPVCNTAKLISIFHVSSYSLRSHAQRDLYWVGSHSCQAFVVKVKTSTTIFHQLTQSHFASVCPLESPRMQLCVRERRWKFWFVQFRAWWLTSVDCGKRSVFHTGSVSHISFAIFFLFFFSEEAMHLTRLHYLTYILAEMEESGVEPIEIFICSP